MSQGQLAKKLETIRRKMLIYKQEWPRRAGILALDIIDGNFRNEGYRDKVLISWRRTVSGKKVRFGQRSGILNVTGKLRRDMGMAERKEAVRIYNRSKYARVHNEGFKGRVQVNSFVRRNKISGAVSYKGKSYSYGANYSLRTRQALKPKAVTTNTQVKAHTREMNIPRRQFMPSETRGSYYLQNEVRLMTEKQLTNILKNIR